MTLMWYLEWTINLTCALRVTKKMSVLNGNPSFEFSGLVHSSYLLYSPHNKQRANMFTERVRYCILNSHETVFWSMLSWQLFNSNEDAGNVNSFMSIWFSWIQARQFSQTMRPSSTLLATIQQLASPQTRSHVCTSPSSIFNLVQVLLY